MRDRINASHPSAHRLLTRLMVVIYGVVLILQLLPAVADAGQISSRSVTLSTSAASAAATYTLTFTPVANAQELILDFCSNSPLVGDTCSFSAANVPTIASPLSSVGTASSVGSGTPLHTIKVTGLTMTAGTPFTVSFTSGVTNPTTNTTFYARILTFTTGNASGYAPANTTGGTPTSGSYTDYGGAALSTAANLNLTSKVFETLTFCVFQSSCGTPPALILGDPTTGALSVINAYVNADAQYTLATNAGNGIAVTMTGTTLCRSTGANCLTGASQYTISAIGINAAALSAGTEQFGMCADITGSGALTVTNTYNDTFNNCHGLTTGTYAGTSLFGFNDVATSGGTNNVGGSTILTSAGAVPVYTGSFAFLGDISATTEAGLYTSSLNLVATGTF